MSKKGFTLIELLAVIVILAIIALITVPIVLSSITTARKSSAKTSAIGFINVIEHDCATKIIYGGEAPTSFVYDESIDPSFPFSLRGTKPTVANLEINDVGAVISGTLTIGGYDFVIISSEVYFVEEV